MILFKRLSVCKPRCNIICKIHPLGYQTLVQFNNIRSIHCSQWTGPKHISANSLLQMHFKISLSKSIRICRVPQMSRLFSICPRKINLYHIFCNRNNNNAYVEKVVFGEGFSLKSMKCIVCDSSFSYFSFNTGLFVSYKPTIE